MEKKFELDEKNTMLIFSYLWIFALVPRLVKKDDPEILWHSKNGLGLFIIETLIFFLSIPFFILSLTLFKIFLPLFVYFYFLFFMGTLILHLIFIFYAINGKKIEIPYISEYFQKL